MELVENGPLQEEEPVPEESCLHRLDARCNRCCMPCLTSSNPLPTNPSRLQRFRYACMCPPHGHLARAVMVLLAFVLAWAVFWSITGPEALPGGNFFGLIILFLVCIIFGKIFHVIRLPDLLGMLIAGVLLRNVPYIDFAKAIDPTWASSLRSIALAVILVEAGLGLDPRVLRRLSLVVVRLACSPCIIESMAIGVFAHFLLKLPWVWSFMLGFVLSAVSPAVIVPSLLSLRERGYGVEDGVPTLLIAASSFDDVLAITGFGILQGVAFSSGHLAWTVLKGPVEAIVGILLGIFFGVLLWFYPPETHRGAPRILLMCLICLFCIFLSRSLHMHGIGPLACLVTALVGAYRWRRIEKWCDQESQEAHIFAVLWMVFKPLLFGLIGAEIQVSNLDPHNVGLGVAVLVLAMLVRMLVAFLVVFRAGLSWREMFFVPLSWIPKATVQAAIGPIALDVATKTGREDLIAYAQIVLTIAVFSILLWAPVGSIAIAVSGPRLLKKVHDNPTQHDCVNKTEGNDTHDHVDDHLEEKTPGDGDSLLAKTKQ